MAGDAGGKFVEANMLRLPYQREAITKDNAGDYFKAAILLTVGNWIPYTLIALFLFAV